MVTPLLQLNNPLADFTLLPAVLSRQLQYLLRYCVAWADAVVKWSFAMDTGSLTAFGTPRHILCDESRRHKRRARRLAAVGPVRSIVLKLLCAKLAHEGRGELSPSLDGDGLGAASRREEGLVTERRLDEANETLAAVFMGTWRA